MLEINVVRPVNLAALQLLPLSNWAAHHTYTL